MPSLEVTKLEVTKLGVTMLEVTKHMYTPERVLGTLRVSRLKFVTTSADY